MSSTNPSPLSALEDDSRDLAPRVRARLTSFWADPGPHARFLNMLSLLEHIGSRKIMASQEKAEWDHDILKHLAEETRHAFFFKRAAERMARRALDYSAANTMAGASARAYMGRLDAEIARHLGPSAAALPYLYMSLIVELRAVWTYRIYQKVLAGQDAGLSLKSVLAEEELHLAAMLARLRTMDRDAGDRVTLFCGFEAVRFRALWSAIEGECVRAPLAAE